MNEPVDTEQLSLRSRLKAQLQPLVHKLATLWEDLQPRERMLVAGASGVALLFALFLLGESLVGGITAYQRRIANLEQDVREVKGDLESYVTLLKRKEALQHHYKSVQITEGVSALLERVIKEKAGLAQSPFVQEKSVTSLGNEYEVVQFAVNAFQVDSLKKLTEALSELAQGEKPVIITRLGVRKTAGGDKLEVQLEVSSIRLKEV